MLKLSEDYLLFDRFVAAHALLSSLAAGGP